MHYFIKTLLLALMCSAIACTQNSTSNKSSGQSDNTAAAVQFANETDFICGMKVSPEYEDTCHYQGKVYAFCSASCKETFQEEPEKYVAGK